MLLLESIRVLLLNASYEPIKVLPWQRGILLWFQEKAEILEFHRQFVRSAHSRYQVPSVIRLKHYTPSGHLRNVRFCRENIYVRDNYRCQYCGKHCHHRELTLDHVIPLSKAGPKTWQNVVSACRNCNQKKGARTPRTANMPLLNEPRAPVWLPTPELDPRNNKFPTTWLTYLQDIKSSLRKAG